MRRLADFRGLFDDEKEEEFLAEEEAEGRETDEEEDSSSVRAGLPQTSEVSSLPQTADPPLPAGSPPADVAPPPPSTPADVASEDPHASTEVVSTTGVKRTREGVSDPSADPLRVTRRRTEGAPIESRAGSGEPVVVGDQAAELSTEQARSPPVEAAELGSEQARSPPVEEHRDQAAGLVSDEVARAVADVDPSKQDDEEGDVLVGDGEFAHSLEEGNEHGFKFAYNGTVPFLNHKEASAGFQRAVYSTFHGEEAPSELILAAEVAELARLEQRVAYKRTRLNFSYERLLAEERSSAQARFVAVEKERDAAIDKVKELESSLASVKKSGRSRKLKKKLDTAEAENADLKKAQAKAEAEKTVLLKKAERAESVKIALKEELRRMESEKNVLEKALEAEVEASRTRELALKSSREAEETGAKELAELKADYDQLSEVGALEVKCFRERLVLAKQRFDALRVASEARLGKLLEEQKFIEEYSSFYIQMKGVFDTLERLETKFAIEIPPIFERQCREREGKLERWLEDMPQLSYEASDFELPADLGLDSLIDFMVEEPDERADDVQDGSGRADGEVAEEEKAEDEVAEDEEARGEEIRDEVAGDANLPEESEAVRRDE
ncbi:unnamed protein product [Cochlearia groenlandica]